MKIEKKADFYLITVKHGYVIGIDKWLIINDSIMDIEIRFCRTKEDQFFAIIQKEKNNAQSKTGLITEMTEIISFDDEIERMQALFCAKDLENEDQIRKFGFNNFYAVFLQEVIQETINTPAT